MESGDNTTAEQLIYDYRTASLPPEQLALCDFAVKLSLAPGAMKERDVAALREFGFSDESIHLATQIISYFNYINRVADGLGIEPETWMQPAPEIWFARKARFAQTD